MKKLKKKDYIGVISSSGLLKEKNKDEIEKSIKLINEMGLNVKLGKHIYENLIILSKIKLVILMIWL